MKQGPKPIQTGPFEEDIAAQAQRAFDQASETCAGCLSYHGVWGYQRLARQNSGLDGDRAQLEPLIAPLIASGQTRVLIAGCADTGQLAMVLRAASGRDLEVTIIDRCETPLALCRGFAAQHGVPVSTRVGDIGDLSNVGTIDLILAHSVLSFLPDDQVFPVVQSFANALSPNGHLVMTTALSRTKPPIDPSVFADRILAAMDKHGLETPTEKNAFCNLLADYARGRQTRGAPFSSVREVTALLLRAGMVVEQLIDNKRGTSYLANGTVSERIVPGIIVTARRADRP
ncbi:MAG: class I SAM-dependent methyltransferase [Pseudomonadota bacterium]